MKWISWIFFVLMLVNVNVYGRSPAIEPQVEFEFDNTKAIQAAAVSFDFSQPEAKRNPQGLTEMSFATLSQNSGGYNALFWFVLLLFPASLWLTIPNLSTDSKSEHVVHTEESKKTKTTVHDSSHEASQVIDLNSRRKKSDSSDKKAA